MPRPLKRLNAQELFSVTEAIAAGESRRYAAKKFDISPSTVGTIVKNFSGLTIQEIESRTHEWDKYKKIFRAVFQEKYAAANQRPVDLRFTTQDIARWKRDLKLEGGNPYDLKYNAKGRGSLPDEIQATAPKDMEWRIVATGKGEYVFSLFRQGEGVFEIDPDAIEGKILDSLPKIVERYAREDEQALLARIRYNRLIDAFLGISAYSLQSHWKTSIRRTKAPVEIDEMYVGIDADGSHYMIPVEAKGRESSEKITAEQLLNNFEAVSEQFPNIPCIAVAAKVIDNSRIAMIRFRIDPKAKSVDKEFERHYVLATNPPPPKDSAVPVLTDEEIQENAKEYSSD